MIVSGVFWWKTDFALNFLLLNTIRLFFNLFAMDRRNKDYCYTKFFHKTLYCLKKMLWRLQQYLSKYFPLKISSVYVNKSAVFVDLLIFTKEILNQKLHILVQFECILEDFPRDTKEFSRTFKNIFFHRIPPDFKQQAVRSCKHYFEKKLLWEWVVRAPSKKSFCYWDQDQVRSSIF